MKYAPDQCCYIEEGREFSFYIFLHCLCEEGILALWHDNPSLGYEIGYGCEQEYRPIEKDWYFCKMILCHICCCKRYQREPEKEMSICPHDSSIDMFHGVKHVVMIVPIDGNIDKAQDISEKNWYEFHESMCVCTVGDFELQYHDSDDDSDDSIAKGFEAIFVHKKEIFIPILEIIARM